MPFTIAKDFSFCFGHRVWSQVLNAEFANDLQCACRHLHGHEAKVTVHLTSDKLERGMVTDFRHLEWFKKFLDSNLDHKFVLDRNDPLFAQMTQGCALQPVYLSDLEVGHTLVLPEGAEGAQIEYLQSFFIVDFVPTSENFSEWLFSVVDYKMQTIGVTTDMIEWWESPKSRSVFKAN